MKRKQSTMVLSAAMAAMMLVSGCGSNGGSAKQEAATKNADGKYEPILTISIAKQLDENTGRYEDGDDINNNQMTRLAEKKLGIKMETTLLGGDAANYDTKLRLALTGSEELPDVFPVYGTQMIADMIESGKVKAIDDDIEKYMPDRLKEIYDKYPETFYPVTKDGKTYGIACTPALTEGQVMIVRQDWLDNLGLEAPTNMDEFEAVIKAFTEDDPDGNGKADTYGFTYSGNDIYNTGWVADPVTLFSTNSGKYIPGSWQEDEDGNLVYGSINEGNKETLIRMAEWQKNGWIFQEAAATGAWDAMTQFTEGKAGIFIGRPWAIDSVKDVTSTNPDAVIKAYPNIKQDNGDPTYQTAQINDGWLMFNKDFDNMEAFFTYYDWMYDYVFGTGDFEYGYVEGCDYDIIDGEPVYDSTKFDPPVTDPFMPGKSTVLKNNPIPDSMETYAKMSEESAEPTCGDEFRVKANFTISPSMSEGYVIANEYRDTLLPNLFNAEPTDTMKKKWEQLQTMEKQVYTNIIYGKEDPSAFDQFVEDWKAQGGDDITKEVNEWYQSVK